MGMASAPPRAARVSARAASRFAAIGKSSLPSALTNATGVHSFPRAFDDARAVAVRDDARERHPETEPVDALLRVAGIDSGEAQPHPDFSGTRLRRGQLAHAQHFRGRTLLVVPSGPHHGRPTGLTE
jgi:hypothetical protein